MNVATRSALFALLFTASPAVAQHGFNLEPSLILKGDILSGGPPRDGIPALVNPAFVPAEAADYLEPNDLVVGLDRNGETRAYPLRILVWHEVANDTLGGEPVVVTYCPLCKSTLVFDGKVGGTTRQFGVSGLLYHSNVLMYDRQEARAQESLWSQAEMRAVTGPAAAQGLKLRLLPSELTTWSDWRDRYPGTKVLSLKTGHARAYGKEAYASYFATDELMFPVREKKLKPRRFKRKEPMTVVFAGDAARAYAARDIAGLPGGALSDDLGGRMIRLVAVDNGRAVRVETEDEGAMPGVATMFWFTLSALQPGVDLYAPP